MAKNTAECYSGDGGLRDGEHGPFLNLGIGSIESKVSKPIQSLRISSRAHQSVGSQVKLFVGCFLPVSQMGEKTQERVVFPSQAIGFHQCIEVG